MNRRDLKIHRIASYATALVAMLAVALPDTVRAGEIIRQLQYSVTVDAQQNWKKNDGKTGDQWSKATSKQHYEVTAWLKSDGRLQVRNIEDLDLNTRLEAKTIFLARQAKRQLERSGKPFKIPRTEQEKQDLNNRMQADMDGCKGNGECAANLNMQYAAIFAAMEHPEALEEDTVPGTFLYFLPYHGCPQKSRTTLDVQIDGIRYNKTSDKLVPFSEHHAADSVDVVDDLQLCDHFTAVIDTQDKVKPMYLDNVFVTRPEGTTTYTESGSTRTTQEPQPVPSEVVDWLAATLRHAPSSGSATTTVPLILPLNANSTPLGIFQGTAKVSFQWAFTEVTAAQAAAATAKPK